MPLGPKLKVEPTYPRLYRSRTNRKIAGICGGIATLTKIDPTVIRITLIVALFVTGVFPVLIAYFVGIALIPEEPR
ncbi:MAG: PspC domain-containing protein [Chlamydiales bacterium]|nr:PspC domain-containing protein [Chlamydiales bacterium]